jgi:predicted ATPase
MLPETAERTQREVDIHIALGASLIATQGPAAPEVEHTYLHAQHLCARLESPPQLFPILRGLWNYYLVRAEYQTAHALGEQLLALAQHARDPVMLVTARSALGSTLFYLGAVATAHTHFTQGIALYDSQQHRASAFLSTYDTGVVCHSVTAWALWYMGYPDQGLTQSQQAVTLAQQLTHPYSLGFALNWVAIIHQLRREARWTQERTEAVITLATEQGFSHWRAMGGALRGWALAHQGQVHAGIEQIQQSLVTHRATGAGIGGPWRLALLAEAYGTMEQPEGGLTALTEALALVETTGERWYEPELYRLKGVLLLQQSLDNQTAAETCFHHALEIARNQQAKSFELRTATSLARLWQRQGKHREAYDLLAPVYNWFTEGFTTADLQDAKALLGELEDGR